MLGLFMVNIQRKRITKFSVIPTYQQNLEKKHHYKTKLNLMR